MSPRHRELWPKPPRDGQGLRGSIPWAGPWGALGGLLDVPGRGPWADGDPPLHPVPALWSVLFFAFILKQFFFSVRSSLDGLSGFLWPLGDWGRSLHWGLVPHCGGLSVLAESGRAALGHCPDGSGIVHKSDLPRSRPVLRWGPSQPDPLGLRGALACGTPVLGVCRALEVPVPGFPT